MKGSVNTVHLNLIETGCYFLYIALFVVRSQGLKFLHNLFRKFPNPRKINLENLFIWIMTNEDLVFDTDFSLYLNLKMPDQTGKILRDKSQKKVMELFLYFFVLPLSNHVHFFNIN